MAIVNKIQFDNFLNTLRWHNLKILLNKRLKVCINSQVCLFIGNHILYFLKPWKRDYFTAHFSATGSFVEEGPQFWCWENKQQRHVAQSNQTGTSKLVPSKRRGEEEPTSYKFAPYGIISRQSQSIECDLCLLLGEIREVPTDGAEFTISILTQ